MRWDGDPAGSTRGGKEEEGKKRPASIIDGDPVENTLDEGDAEGRSHRGELLPRRGHPAFEVHRAVVHVGHPHAVDGAVANRFVDIDLEPPGGSDFAAGG